MKVRLTRLQIAVSGFVSTGVLALWVLFHSASPYVEINRRHRLYKTVTQEMTEAEVVSIMGPPDRAQAKPISSGPFWDRAIRPDIDTANIDHVIHYSTSTFYLPVTFEFAFDAEGNVIGKHSYD